MTYLEPPFITRRVFNPLAMRFGIGGAVTLVVAGRRTGKPLEVPVIVAEVDGGRYLVSTRGESDWVRNLRAAGSGELRRKGSSERFTASELPVGERPPVITAYVARAGRTVEGYFRTLPDPADHPVFRVEPAAS
jgi:deazaflavin-dependent oxidoreductase (nitroreductase family)